MVATISKEDLLKAIEEDEVVVINVLEKDLYDNIHIKGSISIPLDELETEEWNDLDPDKKYVVYCYNHQCSASTKAAEFLESKGFQVQDFEGGITEWAEEGMPTEGAMSPEDFLNA